MPRRLVKGWRVQCKCRWCLVAPAACLRLWRAGTGTGTVRYKVQLGTCFVQRGNNLVLRTSTVGVPSSRAVRRSRASGSRRRLERGGGFRVGIGTSPGLQAAGVALAADAGGTAAWNRSVVPVDFWWMTVGSACRRPLAGTASWVKHRGPRDRSAVWRGRGAGTGTGTGTGTATANLLSSHGQLDVERASYDEVHTYKHPRVYSARLEAAPKSDPLISTFSSTLEPTLQGTVTKVFSVYLTPTLHSHSDCTCDRYTVSTSQGGKKRGGAQSQRRGNERARRMTLEQGGHHVRNSG